MAFDKRNPRNYDDLFQLLLSQLAYKQIGMNVMEYLVPVLTTKKKLEDKILEFKDTLNLYLPEDQHYKDKNILGMEKKNKVADEDSSSA